MPNLHPPAPTFDDVWRTIQELALLGKETDRKFQETDRKLQETDRMVKELSRNMGHLSNRLGDFVEEMVKPSLVQLFQTRGIQVHRTMQNMTSRDDAGQFLAQVDLLVINSDTAIAVECKSHLSVDDVNEHMERLAQFKKFWPEYTPYRLLGAVAAMALPDDVGRYAYRKGLFVLAQSGETVEIRNNERFEPKIW